MTIHDANIDIDWSKNDIYIPAGKYTVTEPIVIGPRPELFFESTVRIHGDGAGLTILETQIDQPIMIADYSVDVSDIGFRATWTATGKGTGIVLKRCKWGTRINRCQFVSLTVGVDTVEPYSSAESYCHYATIDQCSMVWIGGYGVRFRDGHHANRVTRTAFNNGLGTGKGIYLGWVGPTLILDSVFAGGVGGGELLAGIEMHSAMETLIRNCGFELLSGPAVDIGAAATGGMSKGILIDGNNCTFRTATYPFVRARDCSHLMINANFINGAQAPVLDADATAKRITYTMNYLDGVIADFAGGVKPPGLILCR